MTGYGRSKKRGEVGEAWARSVNGRFLEVRVHLPREWAALEPELRSLAQTYVARGTVDLHINRSKTAENAVRVEVDESLATQWAKALNQLAKLTSTEGGGTQDVFSVLARAPEVIRVVHETEVSEDEKARVFVIAREALEALKSERVREGNATRAELIRLLDALDEAVLKVSALAATAPDDLRARLKARLEKLEASGLQPPGAEDARFHQEVALLIDRGDIQEEIARLAAHLKVYRDLVSGDGEQVQKAGSIGKTLDFYAQELLREVNTVGSKSQTAEMTRLVVEAKTLVEKIREQVQNVE